MNRLTITATVLLALAARAGAAPPQDPWLPPAQRLAQPAPETRGATLQAQALAKLETEFRRAAGGGSQLSRAQAQQAGLGFVLQNFGAMDSQGSGQLQIEDLRRFLAQPPAERARLRALAAAAGR